MSLDIQLHTAQAEVPECLAVGYVDMGTGMLLSITTTDSHLSDVIDLVARATADLFQGSSVTAIERHFRIARGHLEDGSHYFQEIFVLSDNLLHVFLRGKRYPEQVLVFVCHATVNLGIALVKARHALPEIENAFSRSL